MTFPWSSCQAKNTACHESIRKAALRHHYLARNPWQHGTVRSCYYGSQLFHGSPPALPWRHMTDMASQSTSNSIVWSTVCSGAHKKHRSASQAFVRGIHRSPVVSPHKGPVTRKMFPFDDVIMVDPLESTFIVSSNDTVLILLWLVCFYWYNVSFGVTSMAQSPSYQQRNSPSANETTLKIIVNWWLNVTGKSVASH